MNKLIITLLALSVLMVSCGPTGVDTSELARKMKVRDSLNTQIAALAASLSEVEEWIAENDTNVTKNLTQITTQPFMLSTYRHFVEVHGTVKSDKNAMLYPGMMGEIKKIRVKQGDKVKAGEWLVAIDAGALDNNIKQMETQLTLATDLFQRQERLWKNEMIGSEVQYLEAKTNKESLEASIASLRAQRRTSQIRAPFAGVVDEIFPNVGDMANPAMPVLRIVAPSVASIESDVAEEYLAAIKEGDSVDVVLGIGDTLKGNIEQIGGFINPGNRTFKVTSKLTASDEKLLPNQLTTVRICNMAEDNAYVLSPRLIMEDAQGESYVYVTNSKEEITEVRKVYVKRLMNGKREVLIERTDELRPGDLVVDQGARLVVEKQRVRVKNNKDT